MKSWTELCQANLNHHNDHPTAHTLGAVAYGVIAVGAIIKMAHKSGQSYIKSYTEK